MVIFSKIKFMSISKSSEQYIFALSKCCAGFDRITLIFEYVTEITCVYDATFIKLLH